MTDKPCELQVGHAVAVRVMGAWHPGIVRRVHPCGGVTVSHASRGSWSQACWDGWRGRYRRVEAADMVRLPKAWA